MNSKNFKIWTLTDGSEGMLSQVLGLAQEFSNNIHQIKTELKFPWSILQPGILPIFKFIFKNKIPDNNLPNLLISCGRKSVYLSVFLKKNYSDIINIHIQNPKIAYKNFDYIISPNHDNIKGNNIINSVGAIHKFDYEKLLKIEENFDIPKKNLLSCLIGGQNQHYYFRENEAIELCNSIMKLKYKYPQTNLLIISSRRTSVRIKQIIKNKFNSISNLWLGNGKNPYEFALKYSSKFIVTSDSSSMISEAAISGKPIYVYNLPFKRKSKRFEKFHEEYKRLNITRDLNNISNFDDWSYSPLNESKRIAGIIKERIIEDNL